MQPLPTFGRPPRWIVVFAVLGLAVFFVLPIVGLVASARWDDLLASASAPGVRSALVLSLICASGATALSFVFGIPLAWLLARATFPGRRVVRTIAALPLVLPPVVGGTALLLGLGPDGIAGRLLDEIFGLRLPSTTAGAMVAGTFVAMPFLVLTVEGALRSLDRRYEETAATLGARPHTLMFRVALPLVMPSIAAGAVLTWARALGEFGATITFAGSVPGRTQTLPLQIYATLETDRSAAIALSVVLLGVSIAIIAGVGTRARASLARVNA